MTRRVNAWILSTILAAALSAAPVAAQTSAPATPAAPTAKPAAPTAKPAAPQTPTAKPAAPTAKPAAPTAKPAATAAKPAASATKPAAATAVPAMSAAAFGPGVYAHFVTNKGNFTARLFDKDVPKTVENFVSLAEGKKQWKNPKTNTFVRRPYYNNLTFHRVLSGFMIQGGDPEGSGMGGPGYTFADEFTPKLRHSKAGILSMANRGPNTNGGQFFITLVPTPWLDGKHTVFGEIVDGMAVVEAIGKVPVSEIGASKGRPVTPVVMKLVKIERVS